MNWQDVYEVRSYGRAMFFDKMYHIVDKRTGSTAKHSNPTGYADLDEAFAAAKKLFKRMERELEKIVLG